MRARWFPCVAVLCVAAFVLGGCSTQARAERKGKSAGTEICKAKDADNANDAQRHLRKANDKLDDLARFTGRDVREDLRGMDRNLDQLSRGHGTEQDVNAIERSVQQAKSSTSGNAEAAYDGMLEALANCD
jgi:hypothetical protein